MIIIIIISITGFKRLNKNPCDYHWSAWSASITGSNRVNKTPLRWPMIRSISITSYNRVNQHHFDDHRSHPYISLATVEWPRNLCDDQLSGSDQSIATMECANNPRWGCSFNLTDERHEHTVSVGQELRSLQSHIGSMIVTAASGRRKVRKKHLARMRFFDCFVNG